MGARRLQHVEHPALCTWHQVPAVIGKLPKGHTEAVYILTSLVTPCGASGIQGGSSVGHEGSRFAGVGKGAAGQELAIICSATAEHEDSWIVESAAKDPGVTQIEYQFGHCYIGETRS